MSLALRAIVKLTLKSALRSHVFQALLFLLFLGVLLVPNTVKGDGTAYGFIQVSIDYSLWIISVILSMSALWVGCSVMCADIEGGQLHMVVAKPVSRITVFCGKLLGVLILHAILMLIASGAAYGFVMLQFSWQKFSPTEKARVEAECPYGAPLLSSRHARHGGDGSREVRAARESFRQQHWQAVRTTAAVREDQNAA
jgi:ABC-type transport system involved in multi-copper enzyme maturation permease subunit